MPRLRRTVDSADVWIAPVGAVAEVSVYAPAAAIGLAPISPAFPVPPIMGNDIDALGRVGCRQRRHCHAWHDFALFSLAPGSVALAALGNSPADIFFTDFSGSYAIYASAADLGLLPADNVDALEICLSGDANLNRTVNLADLATLDFNYNVSFPVLTMDLWTKGDFDGNGWSDCRIWWCLPAAFGGTTGGAGTGADSPSVGVPEPVGLVLAALVIVGADLPLSATKNLGGPAVFADSSLRRNSHRRRDLEPRPRTPPSSR